LNREPKPESPSNNDISPTLKEAKENVKKKLHIEKTQYELDEK
jgi:hypothetical protein